MQPLGRKLREIREVRGLSMREAAERVGVQTHTTWSRWEGGQTTPSRDSMLRIAEKFDEDMTDYIQAFFNRPTRSMRRLEGRVWSMMGEHNVAETFNIGDHVVELLKDGNLFVNSRTLVLLDA